jgi:hypothetical protein
MGIYKGKVQNICTGSYIQPSADDKRSISVSREMVQKKKKKGERKKVIYQEAQRTSSWTRGLESQEKKRITTKRVNHVGKYHTTKYMEQACLSFWAYTRKIRL